MNLGDLKRSKSKTPVYSARLADEEGNYHYELLISGSQKQVETVFEKSNFEIEIAPSVTEEQFPPGTPLIVYFHSVQSGLERPPAAEECRLTVDRRVAI